MTGPVGGCSSVGSTAGPVPVGVAVGSSVPDPKIEPSPKSSATAPPSASPKRGRAQRTITTISSSASGHRNHIQIRWNVM